MSKVSIATLKGFDDLHRQRAYNIVKSRKVQNQGGKYGYHCDKHGRVSKDPHAQGTVLSMSEMTVCPFCNAPLVRREMSTHRRRVHS